MPQQNLSPITIPSSGAVSVTAIEQAVFYPQPTLNAGVWSINVVGVGALNCNVYYALSNAQFSALNATVNVGSGIPWSINNFAARQVAGVTTPNSTISFSQFRGKTGVAGYIKPGSASGYTTRAQVGALSTSQFATLVATYPNDFIPIAGSNV